MRLIGACSLIGITMTGCTLPAESPGPYPSLPMQRVSSELTSPSPQTLRVRATDMLRDRPIPMRSITVNGREVALEANGVGRAALDPGATASIRLVAAGYLTLNVVTKVPITISARLCPSHLQVLAVGDSITAGLKVDPADRYDVLLRQGLMGDRPGLTVSIQNAGRVGDTFESSRDRLDRLLLKGQDVTLVELGTNDVTRTPLERFARTVERILSPLHSVSPLVCVADIPFKPRWAGPWNQQSAAFDSILVACALNEGAIPVTLSRAFREAGDTGDWDLFAHDAPYDRALPDTQWQGDIHPNARGHALIARAFEQAILEATEPTASLTPSQASSGG